jgi:hypothetical protein
MAFERQATQNNPFTFNKLLFSRNVFFSTLISDYNWLFSAPYLSLVLCAQYGQKYHCSIQHNKLYLQMSNVLLNNSILAIYGHWKTSEIVLLTNCSKLIKNAVRLKKWMEVTPAVLFIGHHIFRYCVWFSCLFHLFVLAFSHKVADADTDSNWYTIMDIQI